MTRSGTSGLTDFARPWRVGTRDEVRFMVIDGGTYTLASSITIGTIDTGWLASRAPAEIARLSRELSRPAGAV